MTVDKYSNRTAWLFLVPYDVRCQNCYGWGGGGAGKGRVAEYELEKPCTECRGTGLNPVPHSEFYGRNRVLREK